MEQEGFAIFTHTSTKTSKDSYSFWPLAIIEIRNQTSLSSSLVNSVTFCSFTRVCDNNSAVWKTWSQHFFMKVTGRPRLTWRRKDTTVEERMAVRDTNDEDNKHKRTEQLTENNSLVSLQWAEIPHSCETWRFLHSAKLSQSIAQ